MTQWIYFGLFGLMWFLVAMNNGASLIMAWRRRGSTSLTLFIGGAAGIIAMLVCPLPGTAIWAWVPALLDPGSLPALIRILIDARQARRKRERNLVGSRRV